MSAGPREQTTAAAAKAIREHYDFTEYGGYSEALSCCRNAEDHELHQAQMVADAVVEALALEPEIREGTYPSQVRWVSGWSVVGEGE